MEDKIKLLLDSYGLLTLLELSDITEEAVLELLIESGYINIEGYFDE